MSINHQLAMHSTLEISVPSELSDALSQRLMGQESVISLSLSRGTSLKPPGDTLTVQVLNRGADEVLEHVCALIPKDQITIATSKADSFIVPAKVDIIVDEKDEALWEEIESGLRHQARITTNYLVLMGLGGIISAVGLVSEPGPQAIAFIGAAIIAPGFDPAATVPMALVLRRWPVLGRSLLSALAGYAVLIVLAGLTLYALVVTGTASVADLLRNPEVHRISKPSLSDLLLSAAGAVAGVLMLAAGRRDFIAGPLVVLAIIPAAALIGIGLVVGHPELALQGVERFGADISFILVLGLLVFWLNQRFVHQRPPLV